MTELSPVFCMGTCWWNDCWFLSHDGENHCADFHRKALRGTLWEKAEKCNIKASLNVIHGTQPRDSAPRLSPKIQPRDLAQYLHIIPWINRFPIQFHLEMYMGWSFKLEHRSMSYFSNDIAALNNITNFGKSLSGEISVN